MAGEPSLTGCELWPIPGMAAQAALSTPEGSGLAFLAGARNAPEVLIVAGDELDIIRGLAIHAVRQGLGSITLVGMPGERGPSLVRAAAELARRRGAQRVALIGHGSWSAAAIQAAPASASAVGILDPSDTGSAEPERLRGIPLWIASGVERRDAASKLYGRSLHPRALIELPSVPRLVHAVNDVAAEIIPFVREKLRPT